MSESFPALEEDRSGPEGPPHCHLLIQRNPGDC
jgi:hypothetical protein